MEINLGPLLALGSNVAPVWFRLFRFTRLGQVRASTGVASLQSWLHTVFSIFLLKYFNDSCAASLETHTHTQPPRTHIFCFHRHHRPVKCFNLLNSCEISGVWKTLMHALRPNINSITQHVNPALDQRTYWWWRWHLSFKLADLCMH